MNYLEFAAIALLGIVLSFLLSRIRPFLAFLVPVLVILFAEIFLVAALENGLGGALLLVVTMTAGGIGGVILLFSIVFYITAKRSRSEDEEKND